MERIRFVLSHMPSNYAQAVKEAGADKNGGFCMDVVYGIETNVYNGNTSVQMRVRDFGECKI